METGAGIDELVEGASIVELSFHVRRDWSHDATAARLETAWKADRCAEFIRSPGFRRRFGDKPGVIRMRTHGRPPPDVYDEMTRLGIDIEVGRLPLAPASEPGAGDNAACVVCRRVGFDRRAMSITERGLTCAACFIEWEERQRLALQPRGGSELLGRRIGWAVALLLLFLALRACV